LNPVVYLAGPIANTQAGVAFEWREYAASKLDAHGIETRSPMRAKYGLSGDNIGVDYKAYASRGWAYSPAGILTRDHNDCITANAVLVNMLGAKSMSFGTGMELAWCYDRHIPVVVAIEESGNPHDGHPMFAAAVKFRLADLDDAIDAVAIILNR
jgi:hypothetical protein